jgi:hypothetical protein
MAIKTTVKTINRQYAEKVLEKGSQNRSISDNKVNQYARDMLNSQWVLNHQGIAFDDDGNLIDGQHRLAAIARSGCTVDMLVTTGIPKLSENGLAIHVMDTVDRGRPRSVGDQLVLRHGYKNGSHVAAYAKICAQICAGGTIGSLSIPQTLLVLKHFGDAITQTMEDCQTSEDKISCVGGTISFARVANPPIGNKFAVDFYSMENLGKHHPVLSLRKWLSNHRSKAHGSSGSMMGVRAVASAIQACAEDRTLSKVYSAEQGLDWLRKQYAKKAKDVIEHITMPAESAK